MFKTSKKRNARKLLIERVSMVGISDRSSFVIAAVVDQTATVKKA